MINNTFNLDIVHASWRSCLKEALDKMDQNYLAELQRNTNWLPGTSKIFNAFTIPVSKVNYILFGESPYPRRESANGYAFWDASVTELWSQGGLSTRVNRATSLRNIMKMLLVADDALTPRVTGQEAIAAIDKKHYVQTNNELFTNLINRGFLLLNATLVLQEGPPIKDAKAWYPFMKHLLDYILDNNPNVGLILFGRIANPVDMLITNPLVKRLYAEHPYNHTFITNKSVLDFFKPLHLLFKNDA